PARVSPAPGAGGRCRSCGRSFLYLGNLLEH
uniref:C2H2-type domain-containing protein n=1 Tax=Cyanoderma ruficeps TaxID=181631 RepID=A0A8C3QNK3_9PASS